MESSGRAPVGNNRYTVLEHTYSQTDILDKYVCVSLFVVGVQVISDMMSVKYCADVFHVHDKLDRPKHRTLWYVQLTATGPDDTHYSMEIMGPI